MFKLRKNKKGFTLIELIVVIAILAILAAIAIPSFIGITDNANQAVNEANASTIAISINAYNNLNYDSMIKEKPSSVDLLKSTLGNLYPVQLSDDDVAAAYELVSVSAEGVATVNTEAAAPSPT